MEKVREPCEIPPPVFKKKTNKPTNQYLPKQFWSSLQQNQCSVVVLSVSSVLQLTLAGQLVHIVQVSFR